jgi:DNA polymerase III delta' subunit
MVLGYGIRMWEDIHGHEEQKELFREYIVGQRVPGAMLFCLPTGQDKKKVAIEFFKALNCLERPGDACNRCRNCVKADSLSHPDLVYLEPPTTGEQISLIRSMLSDVSLKPFEAKVRVVIIDPAEDLNLNSSNALLKTLEEPPGSTVFILISHNERSLLPTIVSRCQVIRFAGQEADDANALCEARTVIVDLLDGKDPFELSEKYIPKKVSDAREIAMVWLAAVESVVRDLMVISCGSDAVINQGLVSMFQGRLPDMGIMDDLMDEIHGIRVGIRGNINLRVAFGELFIHLSRLV